MTHNIGHRGACGYEPENTLISFKKAIDLGVDMIELDVHLTRDKEVIVMHDETLDRTTNGKGRLRDKNLSEIKSYTTKDKKQPIPTLQEVIDVVKGKTEINIEIKLEDTAVEVLEIVKKNGIENDVVVSSNYPKSLQVVKKMNPNVRTALLYYATKTGPGLPILVFFSRIAFPCVKKLIFKRLRAAQADYLNLTYFLAKKRFVNELHKLGYKVNVWTVNKKHMIKKMKKVGVDGIITNYPDKI
ncbi:MAG: glycerophosphodiester phosphodiesterase [Candidatus Marinimicrobia bacterium]|nr:glycerophosphodiester phosphodiesterase [Candidatus Neomarinimicrobiota bacterium]